MIMDLTQISEPTLEVKMPDGKILHLLTPDGKLLSKITKLQSANSSSDELYQVVADVLNNNKYLIKYDVEMISGLRIPTINKLMEAYGNFIREVQSNPN